MTATKIPAPGRQDGSSRSLARWLPGCSSAPKRQHTKKKKSFQFCHNTSWAGAAAPRTAAENPQQLSPRHVHTTPPTRGRKRERREHLRRPLEAAVRVITSQRQQQTTTTPRRKVGPPLRRPRARGKVGRKGGTPGNARCTARPRRRRSRLRFPWKPESEAAGEMTCSGTKRE